MINGLPSIVDICLWLSTSVCCSFGLRIAWILLTHQQDTLTVNHDHRCSSNIRLSCIETSPTANPVTRLLSPLA